MLFSKPLRRILLSVTVMTVASCVLPASPVSAAGLGTYRTAHARDAAKSGIRKLRSLQHPVSDMSTQGEDGLTEGRRGVAPSGGLSEHREHSRPNRAEPSSSDPAADQRRGAARAAATLLGWFTALVAVVATMRFGLRLTFGPARRDDSPRGD